MADLPHIRAAVADAAKYVQDTWQKVVVGTLQVPGAISPKINYGLRTLYAASIITDKMMLGGGNTSQRVATIKQIAVDLENGKGPWDMKPMLLGGKKSKISKNGVRYNIIPFRHGTSANYAPNSNFNTMPKDIYRQARELKASVKQNGKMAWGGRLTGTEKQYGPGKNPTTGQPHVNGKYEGMVKISKDYAAVTQSKYLTFRVVTDNSPAGSWWHPGYEPHHIAAGVAKYCRPGIEELIREAALADLVANIDLDMKVT